MKPHPKNRPTSLIAHLTQQVILTIVGLIIAFAVVTMAAITAHFYQDAVFDSRMIFGNLISQRKTSQKLVLNVYNRSRDARIWVVQDTHVIARSRNAPPTPPKFPYTGILLDPITYQLASRVNHVTFVVDWPLSSDVALLRNLSLVVLLVTLAGMGVGVWVSRWATRRALAPVEAMTLGVGRMLDTGRVMPVPMPPVRDEFYDLAGLFNRLLSNLEERRQRDQALLADATHHLRTPMAVIRGNLDLVKTGKELSKVVWDESMAAIDRTLADMSRLVDDLLAMESAHNLSAQLLEPLDLLVLAHEVFEDACAIAIDSTHLAFDNVANGPIWVWAYPEFARRALWSIMDNALKYCDPVNGHIVMALTEDRSSGFSGISLMNNGRGIAAQDMPLIFSRFFRGKEAQTVGGTGLGLSLAQSLMRAQLGTISMASRSGKTQATLWFKKLSPSESSAQ